MTVEDKIIQVSHDLFMQFSIKSITMDDIARELSISKKTIYQYFKDKNHLVLRVTKDHLEKEKLEIQSIKESTSNAIETLIEESLCIRRNITGMNPSLLFDLRKYHHQAWELYLECKQEVYISSLKETLGRGIREDLFREEIVPGILAVLRVEQIQMSLERYIFPRDQFDFQQVQSQLFDHFLNGLVSEKGRKLLSKYNKDYVETTK